MRPGVDLEQVRRVRGPDGAVAHRLARAATTSTTPTRCAAWSATSCSVGLPDGPDRDTETKIWCIVSRDGADRRSEPPSGPRSGDVGPDAPARAPRVHRPLRAGEDHPRRRRPRGRAARGPRSTATSTASPTLVRRAVAAELERITAVVVDAGRAAADVRRRGRRRGRRRARASSPGTTRCSSSSRTSRRRCSATSRSAPATASSIAVGDAFAPAFDRWLVRADATRAGDWLARVAALLRADARTRRSTSPTRAEARALPRRSS